VLGQHLKRDGSAARADGRRRARSARASARPAPPAPARAPACRPTVDQAAVDRPVRRDVLEQRPRRLEPLPGRSCAPAPYTAIAARSASSSSSKPSSSRSSLSRKWAWKRGPSQVGAVEHVLGDHPVVALLGDQPEQGLPQHAARAADATVRTDVGPRRRVFPNGSGRAVRNGTDATRCRLTRLAGSARLKPNTLFGIAERAAPQGRSTHALPRPSAPVRPDADPRPETTGRPHRRGQRGAPAQRARRVRGLLQRRAPHRGLALETTMAPRQDRPKGAGRIRARPVLGGLHHVYERAARSRRLSAAFSSPGPTRRPTQ
jgi:hypothetical protein